MKKSFLKILVSALLIFSMNTAPVNNTYADNLLGDADGSGIIDSEDSLKILQYITGIDSEISLESADVNADGEVNSYDALYILQYVVGLVESFENHEYFMFSDDYTQCTLNGNPYTGFAKNPLGDTYFYKDAQRIENLLETDIFSGYYKKAAEIMNDMTLEEKVGQMFLLGINKTNGNNWIEKYHPGGIVMFAYNFEGHTVQSEIKQIESYQKSSRIPLIISVDEEGGTVVRVSKYSNFRKTPFLSPKNMYASGGFDGIYNETIEKGNLLKSLGINLCLAPVADMAVNKSDYMYNRSFGSDAEETSQFIRISADAYKETGIGCTLKHFPGYGSNLNTHDTQSTDSRPKEDFYTNDFKPFKAGIDKGIPVVLVNHNIVSCFDDTLPSSISYPVHRILREELGFSGLIATDSLDMGAMKNVSDIYIKAVESGNDLILSCESKGYDIVLGAVKNEKIPESRINESVIRIIAYKLYYGIIR